ncbi:MAG: hypothetical protein HOC66_01415, partial [Flavobacteriales bacterium]|nr:hypothetical protein [Flavobacteriales bacterium]
MNLEERIDAFVQLGKFLSGLSEESPAFMGKELGKLKSKIEECEIRNNWFTEDSINNSLLSLSNQLSSDNFNAWITSYNLSNSGEGKRVLLVMAGNIPLVGFHDFLSVIVSGNKAVVKLSSNDNILFQSCRRKDIALVYFLSNIEKNNLPKIHLRIFLPPNKRFKDFYFYLNKVYNFLQKKIFIYTEDGYKKDLISKEIK